MVRAPYNKRVRILQDGFSLFITSPISVLDYLPVAGVVKRKIRFKIEYASKRQEMAQNE